MSRTKAWILVAILALFAGAIAAYSALPKQYSGASGSRKPMCSGMTTRPSFF
jgi:hypothetical protein